MNCWLMVVAFLLGLVLTFAFMLRWVRREMPVYEVLGKGPVAEARAAGLTPEDDK